MIYEISMNEAASRLPELVDRVTTQGDRVVLLKDEEPVAELTPVPPRVKLKDLPAALASGPHLSKEEADAFAEDLEAMRREAKGVPRYRPLSDLPKIMRDAPHLTREEADRFAADLEQMRAEMARASQRDPWES